MGYIALPFRLPEQLKPDRDAPQVEPESFPLSFPVAFQPLPAPDLGPRVRGWVTRAQLLVEGN